MVSLTVTPRELVILINDCLQAGLVPFVTSDPGIGKSAIFKQVARSHNLKVIDHRMSTSLPEDFSGLPRFIGENATFSPFDLFPINTTKVPDGFDGWMLFLDEFNSAEIDVQAAA